MSVDSSLRMFVCVLICFRSWREVLDVGAHKEGAGAAPPQPQEEENHLQLYDWFVLTF